MSVIDELEKLKKLKEQGILTETEFESEKNKILNKNVKIENVTNNETEKINKNGKNISKESQKNKVSNINTNGKKHKEKICKKCGNKIHEG